MTAINCIAPAVLGCMLAVGIMLLAQESLAALAVGAVLVGLYVSFDRALR